MDSGVQGLHITNQAQVYRQDARARSRLTTASLTAYFLGGVLGSALSSLASLRFGWTGVSVLGAGFGSLILGLWLTERAAQLPR
ncbi:hypothetical protein [Deinococcus sp.]|uniref:hypothetical protein n=1 Tax=Deinococcus sp. TaxID=47478 RepID=UPI003CC594E0